MKTVFKFVQVSTSGFEAKIGIHYDDEDYCVITGFVAGISRFNYDIFRRVLGSKATWEEVSRQLSIPIDRLENAAQRYAANVFSTHC